MITTLTKATCQHRSVFLTSKDVEGVLRSSFKGQLIADRPANALAVAVIMGNSDTSKEEKFKEVSTFLASKYRVSGVEAAVRSLFLKQGWVATFDEDRNLNVVDLASASSKEVEQDSLKKGDVIVVGGDVYEFLDVIENKSAGRFSLVVTDKFTSNAPSKTFATLLDSFAGKRVTVLI